MDVSAPCVTSEGKYLQAEKYPQKPSLLLAVFGSKVDILLLGLDFFLKIDVWEKMPISLTVSGRGFGPGMTLPPDCNPWRLPSASGQAQNTTKSNR